MSEQSPDDDDLDELAKACRQVTQSQQRPAKKHRPEGCIERWVENDRKEDQKYSNYLFPTVARFLSEIWTFVVLVLIFIVVKGLWMLLTSSADR